MTRTLWSLVALAVVVYAAFCLYTYLRQRQLIYFPTAPSHAADIDPMWLDSDGERLKLWPLNPGREEALVYFGGNGEDVLFNRTLFESVFGDHSVYLVNYRGYGGSSGAPSQAGFYTDALNVFDAVAARHAAVSVIGRSIGSAVAIHVAARRPVRQLVLVTPMDSVESLAKRAYPLLPVTLLLKDPYRAVDDAPRIDAPTLVVVAERDHIVPLESTERLVEALDGAPVTVTTLPGHDHNSFADDPRYGAVLGSFLRPAGPPAPAE